MHRIVQCRHEPEYVMKVDGVDYYGADQKSALEFLGNLIINFTRNSNIPSVINISELAPHINIGFEKEIMVPWPDFGVPLVRPSFWEALHKYIKKQEWQIVCFHCEAGHGRTGTALACMLIAIQGYTPEEAVWHIRTHYCTEAVETFEQCQYLLEIDRYYNERELGEEDLPIPSIISQIQYKETTKQIELEEKMVVQEDKYEGFKGVTPR